MALVHDVLGVYSAGRVDTELMTCGAPIASYLQTQIVESSSQITKKKGKIGMKAEVPRSASRWELQHPPHRLCQPPVLEVVTHDDVEA